MFDTLLASGFARLAILLMIFAVVAIGAFAVLTFASRRAAVRAGLRDIAAERTAAERATSLRATDNEGAWKNLADMIEKSGLNLNDTKGDRLREKLVAAGYTSASAPRIFTLVRLLLIFALPGLFVLFSFSGDDPPGLLALYLFGCLFALMGMYLPSLFVQAKADRRREAIVNGFPDALDLILVCVEAGLGIEAAMDRVGREMVHSHPLISQLLGLPVLQMRAGASREEAFRKLADSAGVDEIRSFATLLIQSDKLGTSIASTLRVYAEEMRERRRMRAEEKAHRLPVLISIPLVACMLPVMIGVLMLPAAVRVVRELIPVMTGG